MLLTRGPTSLLRVQRDHQTQSAARGRDGIVLAYKMTGNHDPTVLHGEDRVLLALYRLAFPRAPADESRAFLFNYSSRFRRYHRSQVSYCESDIGLSLKAGLDDGVPGDDPVRSLPKELVLDDELPHGDPERAVLRSLRHRRDGDHAPAREPS
jgi:hypothetical protein